jgi:predicted ester cyclase
VNGFDAEFIDLDHYIRVITDRIWEGRRIDDIRRYYSDDCAVETPSSVSIGVQPVIEGTRATLLAFPDRRLLAEDVIASGDDIGGYLSSHRIFSPMTHAGPGVFGAATGKVVFARTIADCVCINNRSVHEWLVRDQAAIARHIGLHERDVAQRWLNERGGFHKAAMPAAPAPYVSFIDSHVLAANWADALSALWAGKPLSATHHDTVIAAIPGGEARVGLAALNAFWLEMRSAFPNGEFSVEHLVANERGDKPSIAVAMRWRLRATHQGAGRYGAPTGRAVEILGIQHAEIEHGKVVREWVLIDDVAVWMQVLEVQT